MLPDAVLVGDVDGVREIDGVTEDERDFVAVADSEAPSDFEVVGDRDGALENETVEEIESEPDADIAGLRKPETDSEALADVVDETLIAGLRSGDSEMNTVDVSLVEPGLTLTLALDVGKLDQDALEDIIGVIVPESDLEAI